MPSGLRVPVFCGDDDADHGSPLSFLRPFQPHAFNEGFNKGRNIEPHRFFGREETVIGVEVSVVFLIAHGGEIVVEGLIIGIAPFIDEGVFRNEPACLVPAEVDGYDSGNEAVEDFP